MSHSQYLTKSLYRTGRECPKRMWLTAHAPHLGKPTSDAERATMEEGIAVGLLAQGLYPGGLVCESAFADATVAATKTQAAIESGAEVLFEASFIAGSRLVRCDILRRGPGGGWIVDEVKASTDKETKELVKKGHVHDLAFQVQTLRQCGLDVQGAGLVLLDRSYTWEGGEHPLEHLFSRAELTDECDALAEEVEVEAAGLSKHLAESAAPEVELNTYCKNCGFRPHCLANTPEDDVLFLPFIRKDKVRSLREAGYPTIREIPDNVLTDRRMVRAHRVMLSGKPFLSTGLAAALDEIRFPVSFIDFETYQTAIPTYLGVGPYRQICFQWSAHHMDELTGEVRHEEFLHPDSSDPRADFCRSLWEAIKGSATLVVYSSFEKQRIATMAEEGVPRAVEILDRLENQTVDLLKIIEGHVWLHEFKYRTSIKTVLPALVPSMSYEGLEIGDGGAAMTSYRRMIAPETTEEAAAKIHRDLLAYCKQDTLAMVEIYRALLALVSSDA